MLPTSVVLCHSLLPISVFPVWGELGPLRQCYRKLNELPEMIPTMSLLSNPRCGRGLSLPHFMQWQQD